MAETSLPSESRMNEAYGRLPLSFETNQGQTDGRVKFISRGGGYTLFLTSNEAVLQLRNAKHGKLFNEDKNLSHQQTRRTSRITSSALRMRFVGANDAAEITGEDELAGKTNYFTGNDRQQWRANVANYARVRYREIYKGVDVAYYGTQQQLEYDFVISPGADPRNIALEFDGAKRIEVDAQGELVLHTTGGAVRQHKPKIYQEIDGEQRTIEGRYVVRHKNTIGFEVADYDRAKPLVIDPILSYATYLGGSTDTFTPYLAVDSSGSAYITGTTTSIDFPTVNPFQASANHNQPGNLSVGFVTKLNAAGTAFVYSTYLGSPNTVINSIAVDANGNAYVAGFTGSNQFPTTPGAFLRFNPDRGGPGSGGFVTKLSPNGASLVYSTYIASPTTLTFSGGGAGDNLNAIAVDAQGNAYIAGRTNEPTFPTTPNAFHAAPAPGSAKDILVFKLNASGSALVYSTFLGSGDDRSFAVANSIAVDSSGNAYLTGQTLPTTFPVTSGAFQTVAPPQAVLTPSSPNSMQTARR